MNIQTVATAKTAVTILRNPVSPGVTNPDTLYIRSMNKLHAVVKALTLCIS
jgi:hypothetical protein